MLAFEEDFDWCLLVNRTNLNRRECAEVRKRAMAVMRHASRGPQDHCGFLQIGHVRLTFPSGVCSPGPASMRFPGNLRRGSTSDSTGRARSVRAMQQATLIDVARPAQCPKHRCRAWAPERRTIRRGAPGPSTLGSPRCKAMSTWLVFTRRTVILLDAGRSQLAGRDFRLAKLRTRRSY